MTETHLPQMPTDSAYGFASGSPEALQLGHVIGDLLNATALTREQKAKKLQCTYLSRVVSGQSCPSPNLMQKKKWLDFFATYAPDLFASESHGGFLKAYATSGDTAPTLTPTPVAEPQTKQRPPSKRSFARFSPQARYMGKIIGDMLAAKDLSLKQAKALLQSSSVDQVLTGRWPPSPHYMVVRNWPEILESLSPELYARPTHGGFLNAYITGRTCKIPTPPKPKASRPAPKAVKQNQQATITTIKSTAEQMVQQKPAAPQVPEIKCNPYLEPFAAAAEKWTGEEQRAAFYNIFMTPNLWKQHGPEGQQALVDLTTRFYDGAVDCAKWIAAASELTAETVEAYAPYADLPELFEQDHKGNTKGRSDDTNLIRSLSVVHKWPDHDLDVKLAMKALHWMQNKLHDMPHAPDQKLRLALFDDLIDRGSYCEPNQRPPRRDAPPAYADFKL